MSNWEQELKDGFEKAKEKKDTYLMNYYGSQLMRIEQTRKEGERRREQMRHELDQIKVECDTRAESAIFEAKMNRRKHDPLLGYAISAGLVLAVLISIIIF